MWWSRLVANHPVLTIVTVLALNWSLIIISLISDPLPSFDDPLVGFEARETQISKRTNAWKLILEDTTSDGLYFQRVNTFNENETKSKTFSEDEELKNIEDMESKSFRSLNHELNTNQFFCGQLLEGYAQIVLSSVDRTDLFSTEAIKTLCQIDRQLLRLETIPNNSFEESCETKNSSDCCKSWSLHNYVLLLSNKSSCDQITDNDVMAVKQLVDRCSPFYHKLELNGQCQSEPSLCRKAPVECFAGEDSVFHIMNYLVDYHFLNPKNPNHNRLEYTNIFLPIAKSTKLLKYFEQISTNDLRMNGIEVVAMDLGLKHTLFERYLLRDTIYLVIACLIILISLYLYTASMIVTLVTILTMLTSLGSAYFFYGTLFRMPFFPFINLLTAIITIGIGSDNALIYCKVWDSAKSDKSDVIFLKLVSDTLSHAWVSMLAASATTSLALFAGYFSDITSLKCFSVFASTSVAINFFITILTLPSAIIIAERVDSNFVLMNCFVRLRLLAATNAKKLFETILYKVIVRFRLLIILLFSTATMLSIAAVTYAPKLQLPVSQEFQILSANHWFERFDLELKNQFWFRRVRDDNDNYIYNMPIRVVFGVDPQDNGDPLDPSDRGSLQLISDFDISSEESQLWLIGFCKELRSQAFYKPTIGPLLSNCFIETFKDWMENRECIDPIDRLDRSPCCQSSVFPFKPSVFNLCLIKVIDLLAKTPNYYLSQELAGPRFDKKSLQLVAAVIEYDSNYTFSHSFIEMNSFWKEVNEWVTNRISGAPKGLRNGWFVSTQLDFFALQLSLSEGTLKSIAFSLFLSFLALLVTTFDLKLSILALISISSTIFSTIAILVALDWKLNVLESISISLAIGLAIDFTLHYTIAYKLAPQQENRMNGIHYTLSRMASPIAMAALTTGLAGLLMQISSILSYVQIGTFLVVLSATSFLYSTFFHLSLLSLCERSSHSRDKYSVLVSLYSCLKYRHPSNGSEPTERSSTMDSIASGLRANGSVATATLSLSNSSTPTNGSFQTQNDCHELERMIKI